MGISMLAMAFVTQIVIKHMNGITRQMVMIAPVVDYDWLLSLQGFFKDNKECNVAHSSRIFFK